MKLHEVYEEFNRRLSKHGQVIIAGGAVRDHLMGKEPKDWDVFILSNKEEFDFKKLAAEIKSDIADLSEIKPLVEWHKSEPFLVATVQWNGSEVQIMVNPSVDVEALLDTFDWNVCLFAFDGARFIQRESIENIGQGKSLRLQGARFPKSSLRRGYRFSERFHMKFEHKDLVTLCEQIIENHKKGKNIGPQGNEPDMPSLEKNTLVD